MAHSQFSSRRLFALMLFTELRTMKHSFFKLRTVLISANGISQFSHLR